MKILRHIGSLAFVLGLFTAVFVGMPWFTIVSDDPVVPWWLRTAVFCLLGGILLVLLTVAAEHGRGGSAQPVGVSAQRGREMLVVTSPSVPGREVREVLGLVQGHTVFAVWLGKDLSALVRLVLGGELTEYTEMMGQARTLAADKMMAQAAEMGADAVVSARYMTTSVVASAAELLVYGTAVKLSS